MEFGFPVGVRFHPTDRELVGHFLHNRAVMGDQFQTKSISDCPDFYGQNEPWVIWALYGGNKSRNVEALYFFTHRNKLNPTAECFDQKVGSGTWREQHSEDVVAKDDSVMGISRHFRYEGGCDSYKNGAWLMQEYQIGTATHNNGATDQELVLCTLRKNPEKLPLPTTTATAKNGNDVEDYCSRSSTKLETRGAERDL